MCSLDLKYRSATDLRRYFLDKISLEKVMSWVAPYDTKACETIHRQDKIVQLTDESFKTRQILAITYRDRCRRLTRRGILVRGYNEEYIRAYCFLRNEERTFRIDRITHAYLSNDDPIILLST